MTTLRPAPFNDDTTGPNVTPLGDEGKPPGFFTRGRRYLSARPKLTAAVAVGVVIVTVAAFLTGVYSAAPGGTLWGLDKTLFSGHSQDVALRDAVTNLKNADDILNSGQQPSPDQLTDARSALNQAKLDLGDLNPSDDRTSMQNLYLQLTQQLRQYTPDQLQQLPPLPDAPPVAAGAAADPGVPTPPPTWGYTASSLPLAPDIAPGAPGVPLPGPGDPMPDLGDATPFSDAYDVPPPDGVPVDPESDWPSPYDAPLTPNLEDLGGYDPSWSSLYGYDPTDWYDWDLSGYNQYGYDFTGYDRWGYDRWGYDRWGYDHWGYGWGGYNWAGYDRNGWDHNGINEWGQHRDQPNDPRNQDWYNAHHPYEQWCAWKFQNNDPVYGRTVWDQGHGVDPKQYQNWNMNRDWKNPFNRDWSPTVNGANITNKRIQVAPVVNLNTSLSQFITNNNSSSTSNTLIKDLSTKSVRDFTNDLGRQSSQPAAKVPDPQGHPGTNPGNVPDRPTRPGAAAAPPSLTASAPKAPPSRVSQDFKLPSAQPVQAFKPSSTPKQAQQPANPARQPGNQPVPPVGNAPGPNAPKPQTPNGPRTRDEGTPAPDPSRRDQSVPASPPAPDARQQPPRDNGPGAAGGPASPAQQVPDRPAPQIHQNAPEPQAPAHQPPATAVPAPAHEAQPESKPPDRTAPQPPAQQVPDRPAPQIHQEAPPPAPRQEEPAPKAAPRPAPEAPPRPAPAPEAPPRPAPAPVHEAPPPPPAPRPAPPAPRPAPAPHIPAPTYSTPVPMPSGHH